MADVSPADIARLDRVSEKNTTDIQNLVAQVSKVATIVENAEKRHLEDAAYMRDMVQGITKLNDRMSATLGMEKDIQQAKEDIRVVTHDVKTALNAIQAIPVMTGKISKLESAVDTLDKTTDKIPDIDRRLGKAEGSISELSKNLIGLNNSKERVIGGAHVLRVIGIIFWTVCGTGIVSFLGWALWMYFNKGPSGMEEMIGQ